ncbi:MAG: phosphodiesterase [Lachnospiraceae bacterium]
MRYMIASDIHGSAFYCRKLFEAFDREREAKTADRMLLLGDLLYHGPRNDLPKEYAPKEVIAMLNERKDSLLCVRGNCEAEVDQMVLKFPVMADYCLLTHQEHLVFATHGHNHNERALPPLKAGDILLHGHTHVPANKVLDSGIVYWNPGSVSIPKENSPHGYMLLSEDTVVWKTLDGELYRPDEER